MNRVAVVWAAVFVLIAVLLGLIPSQAVLPKGWSWEYGSPSCGSPWLPAHSLPADIPMFCNLSVRRTLSFFFLGLGVAALLPAVVVAWWRRRARRDR